MSLCTSPFSGLNTRSAFARSGGRRLRDVLLTAVLWCCACTASNADHLGNRLVVIGPEVNASFLELADAVAQSLREGHAGEIQNLKLVYLDLEELDTTSEDLASASYLVALGTPSLEAVLERVRSRHVYAALVPYAQAINLLAAAPSSVGLSIITAEQPDKRVTELFTLALKGRQRVGVLYADTSTPRINNLLDEFSSSELALIPIRVYKDSSPAREIDRRHNDIDALLAIPDPDAVNSATVRGVLQTAHRHGIPIVGYSQAFVDAGAVAAVFSSGRQIGQHLGELMANELLDASPDKRLLWPRYFKVSLNEQIADSLGMHLAPEDKIQTELEARGTSQ